MDGYFESEVNNYWPYFFADSEWFDQSYLLHSYSGSATVQENGSWTSCFELRLFGIEQVHAMTLRANKTIMGGMRFKRLGSMGFAIFRRYGLMGGC